MSRRRRKKKNPLLGRILMISVAAHVVILPIAAHFGAFKNIRRGPGDSRVVMFTAHATEAAQPEAKKEAQKKKASSTKSSAGNKSAHSSGSNLPQPKVVTSGPATGSGGDSSGPAAESGSGVAGSVPNDPNKPKPAENAHEENKGSGPKTPEPSNPVPDKEKKEPIEPKPAEKVIEAPKPKRIVQAVAIETAQPTIPDELREEPFEKTLIVSAEIDTGGHPTGIRIEESTGIGALDQSGLEAARKYRFRPATIDDEPTPQRVRFRIIFKVD